MGGLNAETAGNLLSGGQDIYNMVEDNKNLRDNYKQDHQRLLHEQQLNREKKTNILEQNLAARRARVAAMGISGDGSAAAEQYREAYNAHKDMAEDDYNYYNDAVKNRRDIRYKIRKIAVNGTIDGTESLLK